MFGRSATREREVEKLDEGYDSTGEVRSSHFVTLLYPYKCTTVSVKLNPLLKKRVILGEGAKEKQAKGEGLQQKGTTSQRGGKFEPCQGFSDM